MKETNEVMVPAECRLPSSDGGDAGTESSRAGGRRMRQCYLTPRAGAMHCYYLTPHGPFYVPCQLPACTRPYIGKM